MLIGKGIADISIFLFPSSNQDTVTVSKNIGLQNATQKSKHNENLNSVVDGKFELLLHNFDTLDLTKDNFRKLSKSKALMYAR